MILNITFAHYKLLLQLQCVQEQLNFSMNQKVTDSLQTKKQEKTFCSCFRNQRGRITRRRQSYEEEEGRKGKVAAKVAVI
jgi:hypothetical protein